MAPVAPTLDARLLAASACAYHVSLDNVFDAGSSAPFYDAVGYASDPVPFDAGELGVNIDACLVGTNADGVILDWSSQVTSDSILLKEHRVRHLIELFAELKLGHIADDHSLGCGGGYAGSICPSLECPQP